MRPHTPEEAAAVLDTIGRWQGVYRSVLGHRMVFAADEYHLLAGRPFPQSAAYEGYPQHENGIGVVRAFTDAWEGDDASALGVRPGFFAWVEGAPAAGYRAVRDPHRRGGPTSAAIDGDGDQRPVAVVTGVYGAQVLRPLLDPLPGVRVVTVENDFFGGNIGVAGLLTGADLARALAAEPEGDRYLLPDACLSEGRFLDGLGPQDLPRAVEFVPTDGKSLRAALGPVAVGAK
jgi:hypothetical protein